MIIKTGESQTRRSVRTLDLPDYKDAPAPYRKDAPEGCSIERPGSEFKLSDALKEIERMKHDLPKLRKNDYDDGFREGYRKGMEEAANPVQQTVRKFSDVIESLHGTQSALIEQTEDFAVKLALEIVTKITGERQFQSLNIGEEKLSALVNDAISCFTDSGKYIIRLHPDSCAELSQNEETIREQLNEKISLVFHPDPSLKPCECVIESDYGVIDARIEGQLDQFGKLLHGVSQ